MSKSHLLNCHRILYSHMNQPCHETKTHDIHNCTLYFCECRTHARLVANIPEIRRFPANRNYLQISFPWKFLFFLDLSYKTIRILKSICYLSWWNLQNNYYPRKINLQQLIYGQLGAYLLKLWKEDHYSHKMILLGYLKKFLI